MATRSDMLQRLLLVVRDIDEGQADLAVERLELDLHVGAQLAVERAQRLVEQQQMRREDQRAGQRHPLLLAARELARQAVGQRAELDEAQRIADLLVDLGLAACRAPRAERRCCAPR